MNKRFQKVENEYEMKKAGKKRLTHIQNNHH